jgi:transposase
VFVRNPIIAEGWGLKEAFRHVYLATSRANAELRLHAFLVAVEHTGLPTFDAFAKGIPSWREAMLNYFDEPTTNGHTEGVINKDTERVINKLKVIKRRVYGLPTFAAFRKRVVTACG